MKKQPILTSKLLYEYINYIISHAFFKLYKELYPT